jgi:hypothetical protein
MDEWGAGRRLYPCAILIRIKIKVNVSNDTVLRVFSERSERSLRERSELYMLLSIYTHSLTGNTLSFLFFYTQSTTRRVYKKRQQIFYPFLTSIGANFCKECKDILTFAQENTQKSRVFTPALPKFIFNFLFRGFVYPILLQLKKPLRKLRDLDALKRVYSVPQ